MTAIFETLYFQDLSNDILHALKFQKFQSLKPKNGMCNHLATTNQAGQKNCNRFWLRFFWHSFLLVLAPSMSCVPSVMELKTISWSLTFKLFQILNTLPTPLPQTKWRMWKHLVYHSQKQTQINVEFKYPCSLQRTTSQYSWTWGFLIHWIPWKCCPKANIASSYWRLTNHEEGYSNK